MGVFEYEQITRFKNDDEKQTQPWVTRVLGMKKVGPQTSHVPEDLHAFASLPVDP